MITVLLPVLLRLKISVLLVALLRLDIHILLHVLLTLEIGDPFIKVAPFNISETISNQVVPIVQITFAIGTNVSHTMLD